MLTVTANRQGVMKNRYETCGVHLDSVVKSWLRNGGKPLAAHVGCTPEEVGDFTVERYELGNTTCDGARDSTRPRKAPCRNDRIVSLDGQQTLHHPDPVYDLVSLTRGGVLMATPLGFKVYDHGVHDFLECLLNGRGIRRFRKGVEALFDGRGFRLYRGWTENQLEQISDILHIAPMSSKKNKFYYTEPLATRY